MKSSHKALTELLSAVYDIHSVLSILAHNADYPGHNIVDLLNAIQVSADEAHKAIALAKAGER